MFAVNTNELGTIQLVTHSIDTGSHPPIKQPVRHTPFAMRENVDQLVREVRPGSHRDLVKSLGKSNCISTEERQWNSFLCRVSSVKPSYEIR